MNRQLTAVVMASAVMLGSAACSEDTPPGQAEGTTSTSAPTASSVGVPSTAAPAPSLSVAAPEAGTPAAVAWEALTGPDGEYMAEATYAAVIDKFGDLEPYVSIRAAEQRHAAALTRQLERFGADAPANPYLGTLQAPGDLKAAAEAGVASEVANIKMYDTLLTQTTDASLTRVLTNLRRASETAHLPMFEAAAEEDGTLTKQEMTDLGFGGGQTQRGNDSGPP